MTPARLRQVFIEPQPSGCGPISIHRNGGPWPKGHGSVGVAQNPAWGFLEPQPSGCGPQAKNRPRASAFRFFVSRQVSTNGALVKEAIFRLTLCAGLILPAAIVMADEKRDASRFSSAITIAAGRIRPAQSVNRKMASFTSAPFVDTCLETKNRKAEARGLFLAWGPHPEGCGSRKPQAGFWATPTEPWPLGHGPPLR